MPVKQAAYFDYATGSWGAAAHGSLIGRFWLLSAIDIIRVSEVAGDI